MEDMTEATGAFRDYANESKSQSGATILRLQPRVRLGLQGKVSFSVLLPCKDRATGLRSLKREMRSSGLLDSM